MGGGVQKTADKWKKVWTDWKTKTKRKYLHIRQQSSGTRGGPNTHIQLTAIEERVMAVIGVSAVVGLAGIQEQGYNVQNSNEQPTEPMHFAEIMLENQSSQNTDPIFDGRASPLPLPSLSSPQRPPEPLQPPLPQQPPQQRLSQPPTPPARNGRRQPSASPRSTMSKEENDSL